MHLSIHTKTKSKYNMNNPILMNNNIDKMMIDRYMLNNNIDIYINNYTNYNNNNMDQVVLLLEKEEVLILLYI
jgi:hypothetical protein